MGVCTLTYTHTFASMIDVHIINFQYKEMSESLAMDEILTDAARRMFLERLVCPDLVA
jgi:hypothetical protein